MDNTIVEISKHNIIIIQLTTTFVEKAILDAELWEALKSCIIAEYKQRC